MSPRRMAIEIVLVAGGLIGAGLLVIWLAGVAAAHLTHLVPLEFDRRLGEQAWSLPPTAPVCDSPEPARYVREIAAPLLTTLGSTPYSFEFRVVNDDEVNAYALPGGFVTVNIGLLRQVETGTEVAAVLAHELQHVLLRHGTKRILRQLGGTTALYLLFGGTDVATPTGIVASLASTAYDRDEEREADRLGLELMRRAGLDPTAMARFFERLARTSPSPPELLSTHPDPGDRASLAEQLSRGLDHPRALPPPPRGLSCR